MVLLPEGDVKYVKKLTLMHLEFPKYKIEEGCI